MSISEHLKLKFLKFIDIQAFFGKFYVIKFLKFPNFQKFYNIKKFYFLKKMTFSFHKQIQILTHKKVLYHKEPQIWTAYSVKS